MKKNSLLIIGLAAVAFVLFSTGNKQQLATNKAGYGVGDFVSDFKLKNIDGNMISMSEYKKAKGFIVVFTCNTCPFSKMYEKRINLLHQKYDSKGYPVLAINSNDETRQPGDSFEAMKQRAKAKNYSFPYLHDESQTVAKAYGATRTPHVYVVTKKAGDLIVSYIGAIDNNHKDPNLVSKRYVEAAVDELLAGQPVSVPMTKAIGCTIKWKAS